jgi:universal stress protein A
MADIATMKTELNLSRPTDRSTPPSTPQAEGPRRLLVPIDFSEASLRALRYAQQLAAKGNGRLTLLNVIEEPLSFRTLNAVGRDRERRNDCVARLMSFARKVVGAGIPLKALVRDGSPARVISRVAAGTGFDMIIVGRHERRGLRRWFYAGTAARLVRLAPCPVIAL